MATITAFLSGGTTGHPANKRTPYLVESVLDGSLATIADDDVVQMIQVPAETICLGAGMEVLTAVTGLTTPAWDLGHGNDPDEWTNDADVSTAGHVTTGQVGNGTAAGVWVTFTTADTIDITANSASGTVTGGKVRVWAVLMDISGIRESATGDQG